MNGLHLLYTLIFVLWVGRIVVNVLAYVQLWWVKEYRFDRMLIHLKTDQGKRIYFLPYRGLRISPKTIGLVIASLGLVVFLFLWFPFHAFVRLLILDIFSFPLTALLVLVVGVPQLVYHKIVITLAIRKLRNHKNLFVIGITGSYGKTSTKEYLATILSSKLKVLKTEASINSAIGIAEVILKSLQPDHEVFVVEMGAYKIGEITHMTAMVRPQVGIITAINEQHQDLFGSIENTMKAKYELFEGLTGKSISIMSGDNPYIVKLLSWAKRDKLNVLEPRYSNIVQKSNHLSFVITLGKESAVVHAPVIGIHQAHNISLAIAAAVAVGMSFIDAAKAASNISPIDRMMKPITGINGATFIDDTFNNNPDAAIAAIDYLATLKGKKIFVFQPMIELGPYAASAHERVGKRAAEVCDAIILTNKNYYDSFVQNKDLVQVLEPKAAAQYIRSVVTPGDTVLFKGKEAVKVLAQLV